MWRQVPLPVLRYSLTALPPDRGCALPPDPGCNPPTRVEFIPPPDPGCNPPTCNPPTRVESVESSVNPGWGSAIGHAQDGTTHACPPQRRGGSSPDGSPPCSGQTSPTTTCRSHRHPYSHLAPHRPDQVYGASITSLALAPWNVRIHHVPTGNTAPRKPAHHCSSATRYAARNARTAPAAARHAPPCPRPTAKVGFRSRSASKLVARS
jgi:hypothetical protein